MAGVVQATLLGKTTQYDIARSVIKNQFGAAANAYFRMVSDGSVLSPNLTNDDWVNLETLPPELYVNANVESGSMTGGTFNTWLAMSSTRTWWLYQSSPGLSTATVSFRVSTNSDGSEVIHNANVSFQAQYVV